MCSTHSEGKSVVAQRFIRTLNNKIYNYITSISKNMCIDKIDDVVNKCNYTYHSTISLKHFDINSSLYIYYTAEKIVKILTVKLVFM